MIWRGSGGGAGEWQAPGGCWGPALSLRAQPFRNTDSYQALASKGYPMLSGVAASLSPTRGYNYTPRKGGLTKDWGLKPSCLPGQCPCCKKGSHSQSRHSIHLLPKASCVPRVTRPPCEALTLTKTRHSWTGLSSPVGESL